LVQGTNRKEARAHGQVTVTRYVCDRCGTVWDYECREEAPFCIH
jgi:hypothetical protein